MSDAAVNKERRTWMLATCAAGGAGAAAVAVPFVSSLQPSARALAAGASVEVDISDIAPGEKRIVEWRGRPIWIFHRTPEQLASLEEIEPRLADPNSQRRAYPTPPYAQNRHRSIKPEFLIAIGICSHLGCSPVSRLTPGAQPSLPNDWPGGFLCPCHGSTFDVAGRVFRNQPAPDNLEIPPHYFVSDTVVVIGEEQRA
jgi:ubiquinol-cytochrome c reductase iron-sulfur subunit